MNASLRSIGTIVIATALLPSTTGAQTCAAPPSINYPNNFVGNSCGQNLLPSLNHGTIFMPGDDVVFHLLADHADWGASEATVTSWDPNFHPALFLCSAPCGSDSQCVSAMDAGTADTAFVEIPYDHNDYYLIIDSQGGCGDYRLTVNGFSDEPVTEPDAKQ